MMMVKAPFLVLIVICYLLCDSYCSGHDVVMAMGVVILIVTAVHVCVALVDIETLTRTIHKK
jgi:hypothetical protein